VKTALSVLRYRLTVDRLRFRPLLEGSLASRSRWLAIRVEAVGTEVLRYR
jgi:hypothetical protein